MKNARSVKQLERHPGKGTQVHGTLEDFPRFVDRVPFFVFAYESNVSGDAAITLVKDEFQDTPWHEQPDGIFVLDDWAAINIPNNDGANRVWPPERRGLVLPGDELPSLVHMLWNHYMTVPLIQYSKHPVRLYHPFPEQPPKKE